VGSRSRLFTVMGKATSQRRAKSCLTLHVAVALFVSLLHHGWLALLLPASFVQAPTGHPCRVRHGRHGLSGTRWRGGPDTRWPQLATRAATPGTIEALLATIAEGDTEAIEAACKALPSGSNDVSQLVGDWKVEWSNLGGGRAKPAGAAGKPAGPPPTVKLNFLSFGSLPAIDVSIVGGFNRVSASAERGGVYELFQVFTMPGSEDAIAAMVLAGPWGQSETGEPGRASVSFQTVTLVPSQTDPEASVDMLRSAGLTVMTPVPVKAPPHVHRRGVH